MKTKNQKKTKERWKSKILVLKTEQTSFVLPLSYCHVIEQGEKFDQIWFFLNDQLRLKA